MADNFNETLKRLSNGDPGIIYDYLVDLIDKGEIDYNDEGWHINRDIADCPVPQSLVKSMANRISGLDEIPKQCLNWLAIFHFPITIGQLIELWDIDPSSVELAINELQRAGLIKSIDDKLEFSEPARGLAVYELLNAQLRSKNHLAIIYLLEKPGSNEIELLAYHTLKAGKYKKAMRYNYEMASQWLKKFDLKKAKHFVLLAEDALCKISRDESDAEAMIKIYMLAGDIARAHAENEKAIEKFTRAAELSQEFNLGRYTAEAYKNLGDVNRHRQKPDEAIEYLNKALRLFEEFDELPSQAATLNNLGLAYWTSGNYDQALIQFTRSLRVNEKLGNLLEQTKIYNNVGIIYDITGRQNEALSQFQKALECAAEGNNPQVEAKCLDNIGYFHLSYGRTEEALKYFFRCYELAVKIGYDEEQLNVVTNIALAYHKSGDFIKSAEANEKALEIAKNLNHDKYQMNAAYQLTLDCLALGNYKTAFQMLAGAEAVCSRLSDSEPVNDILQTKVDLMLAIGDFKQAQKILDVLKLKPSLTSLQQAKFCYQIIKTAVGIGDRDALNIIQECIDKITSIGFDEFHGRALLEKAGILMDTNHFDEARRIFENYRALAIKDIMIDYEYRMLLARLQTEYKAFDEALEIIRGVQQEANNSGCLMVLFQALIIEAEILRACGKYAILAKLQSRIQTLYEIFINTIPEQIDKTLLDNLPVMKSYIKLVDKVKAEA